MLTPTPTTPNFNCNSPPFLIKIKRRAKNCKAPGEDGIVIEMMKAAKIEIVPHLQSLFNKILESGNYPDY